MKNIISVLIIGLMVFLAPEKQAMGHPELVSGTIATTSMSSNAGEVQIAFEQTNGDNVTAGNFFSDNWGTLVLGLLSFFDVVARLTPTAKDNSIVNLLTTVINAIIPNFKKGGGRF